MNKELLYVGLDVHAQTVSIALADPGGEVRNYGSVSSCLGTLEKTIRRIRNAHPGAELRVCYEAHQGCPSRDAQAAVCAFQRCAGKYINVSGMSDCGVWRRLCRSGAEH